MNWYEMAYPIRLESSTKITLIGILIVKVCIF